MCVWVVVGDRRGGGAATPEVTPFRGNDGDVGAPKTSLIEDHLKEAILDIIFKN